MAPLSPLLRPTGRRLWKPGQVKWPGPSRINWTHPLAQGLVFYWWDTGSGFLIDLVSGRTSVPNTVVVPVGLSAFGPALNYNAPASYVDAGPFRQQNWSAPYSYSLNWYQVTAPGAVSTAIFALQDSANDNAFGLYTSGGTTLVTAWGNGAGTFSHAIGANSYNSFTGVATGATSEIDYLNGISTTEAVGSAISGFTDLRMNVNGANASYVTGGAGTFIGGLVFSAAVWNNRALSAADAILLYTDPYCFLLPLEPEMMIIQSAVADVLYPQIWM